MKIKPIHKGGVVLELGPQETQLPPVTGADLAGAQRVFRLKRILVPLDFSECSKKALEYAVPLARRVEAEVTLLHVVQPHPPVPQMALVDVESIQDARKELGELQGEIEGVRCAVLVRTGEPGAEIVAAANETGTDLIILSTHGRTGLARVLMGSTAEKVLRHAGCPILVVREHEQDFVRKAA